MFLVALLIFEVGSVVCGAAPSSVALIVGVSVQVAATMIGLTVLQRAIAGIGSAGVFSGAMVIIAHISPLEKRPAYNGLAGGMFGIASVVGPLVRAFVNTVQEMLVLTSV